MGIYVNPGNSKFRRALRSEIYVDKSLMIAELNKLYDTLKMFVCMSRARRFGKTMMTNLMSAYYSKNCDSREIFEQLKLSKEEGWDKYLNSLNVIQIDLQGFFSKTKDKSQVIDKLQADVVDELREQLPSAIIPANAVIADAICVINKALGEKFVIIIDEYDVLIRDKSVPTSLCDEYIEFLNALFKSNATQEAISLAYLTGILPILRETVQSKLNNFTEYTMLKSGPFAQYFGLTSNEVKDICQEHDVDFEMCKLMYDGYSFKKSRKEMNQPNGDGEPVIHIFNPYSVVQAVVTDKNKKN